MAKVLLDVTLPGGLSHRGAVPALRARSRTRCDSPPGSVTSKLVVLACVLVLVCGLIAGCSSAAPASSDALADGTYDLSIDTDSSMVNVVAASLEVKDGAMTATMSLNGEGFSRVYLGSADDAATAPDSDIYDYTLNDEGKYTFEFPIAELDEDTDVALFGQRRDTWYDHVLVFSLADAS